MACFRTLLFLQNAALFVGQFGVGTFSLLLVCAASANSVTANRVFHLSRSQAAMMTRLSKEPSVPATAQALASHAGLSFSELFKQ